MNLKKLNIHIISRPSLDLDAVATFLTNNELKWKRDTSSTDAETAIEVAGRVCYMSFTDDITKIRYPNSKYINNLIDKKHESVLEHVAWTFILDGVSRAFSHQLVRHRIGFAFSQLSQQYHDESDAEFILPHGLSENSSEFKNWSIAINTAMDSYRSAIKGKQPKESILTQKEHLRFKRSLARSLLPNATSTTMVVTANARALRHFLSIRGVIEGDYEMRSVCTKLLPLIISDAPSVFEGIVIDTHSDGEQIIKLS